MQECTLTKKSSNWLKNMASKASNRDKPYVCQYCKQGFMREKSLAVHTCKMKQRMLQKDEARVRLGFIAFNRFYFLTMGCKNPKTYEEFASSKFYSSFVKFGSYLSNVKPLYTEKYIDYVVNSGVKIDNWTDDELYQEYAVELIRKEGVETALERSIETMIEWSKENNAEWNNYFREVSTNRAVWHIKDGKISPWLMLNCRSGKQLLSQFSDEQLSMVYKILDPQHWSIRFKRYKSDVELVKQIVESANI